MFSDLIARRSSRLGGCGRGCRLVRAGVTGRGVNNRSCVVVVVHEFRIGDLAGEVVHNHQVLIGGVKFGLNIARDGFALGAGVARFADEQVVGGNCTVQRSQLGGGDSVAGEAGKVRVRRGCDVLAIVSGLHVAPGHQVAHGKIHLRSEGVVLGFDGVGVNGVGDGERGGAHGLSRGLFVRRNAAGILRLALRKRLDVVDAGFEVGINVGKRLKSLPNGGAGVANALDGQIHGELVKLLGVHGLI